MSGNAKQRFKPISRAIRKALQADARVGRTLMKAKAASVKKTLNLN
jgi:hypothetical protein